MLLCNLSEDKCLTLKMQTGVENRGTLSESFTFDAPRLIAGVSNSVPPSPLSFASASLPLSLLLFLADACAGTGARCNGVVA